MASPTKMSRRHKLLAFGPALLVIGITALTASGASIATSATAASGNIDLEGRVDASVMVPPTPSGTDCPDPGSGTRTFDFGAGWGGASPVPSIVGGSGTFCTVNFATTASGGADLTFENANAGDPSGTVFCNDVGSGRDCADGSVANTPPNSSLSTANRFGIALASVTGGAPSDLATFGSGVEAADSTPTAAEAIWYPVPENGSPANLCSTPGPNSGAGQEAACGFALGVHGSTTQPSGDYSGTINFAVSTH